MKWLAVLVCLACGVGCDKGKGGGGGSAGSATAGSSGEGSAAESADEGSAAPKTWHAGDVVQVKRDGKWYEAEVVTAGSAYKVLYTFADNVEDNVEATRLRAPKWSKKTHVEAQVGDAWKRGVVVARHSDGAYDIALDDGGETKAFSGAQVRGERKPKSAPQSTAASGGGGSAPCVGPAYMKRCGGTCVNTMVDDNYCGGCEMRCRAGRHCDGHGFCRDAEGDSRGATRHPARFSERAARTPPRASTNRRCSRAAVRLA